MSSTKKVQGISKATKAAKPEMRTSNKQMQDNAANVMLSSMEPQFQDTEGGKKKKGKSGEVKRDVGIEWLDHRERLAFRAKELLHGIKKRQTSGKMIDKQLEFTTKLAQFEEACYVIEAERAEAASARLCEVASPAAWLLDPVPRPHWSTLEGRTGDGVSDEALSVSSEEYQAFAETDQLVKPCKLTDCMKQMCVEADGAFLRSWYASEVGARLRGAGARLREARGVPRGVVGVSRVGPRELRTDYAQMLQVSAGRVRCLRYLYVCEVRGEGIAGEVDGGAEGGWRPLHRRVALVQRALPGQMTLVLVDKHNQYKNGKLKQELHMAIIDLVVYQEVDTVVVSSAEELASLVFHFTRALAEEPYKLAKHAVDSEAEFYMRGDNKHCVTVDQQGNGLSGLWQQMLAVLPHSSLETSRAIADTFTSPRKLAQALSAEGGAARVAALGVARSGAPGARARRLGPEIAHRLHKLLNNKDGNIII